MAFPQFAELWKLVDLLVRKDFRQANLGCPAQKDKPQRTQSKEDISCSKFLLNKILLSGLSVVSPRQDWAVTRNYIGRRASWRIGLTWPISAIWLRHENIKWKSCVLVSGAVFGAEVISVARAWRRQWSTRMSWTGRGFPWRVRWMRWRISVPCLK